LVNKLLNVKGLAKECSAGAVLFSLDSTVCNIEYLLLNYTAGHWDFPKGNIETGEDEIDTARREIREETGIDDVEFLKDFKNKIQYYCPYERAIRSNSRTGSLYLANDLLYLGQLSTTG